MIVNIRRNILLAHCSIKIEPDEGTTPDEGEKPESSEGLEFRLNSLGTAYTLVGIGTCTDTEITVAYHNGIPVKYIGSQSFLENDTITSVRLLDSVEYVYASAFEKCSALTSVTLGKNVRYVGSDAFFTCPLLESVTVEATALETIESYAFMSCTALTDFDLPSTVEYIGINVFDGCNGIKTYTYDNATYIGNPDDNYIYLKDATSKDITEIDIHESTRFIGDGAFFECGGLTSVTIPPSVRIMGMYALYRCASLTEVIVSEGVHTMQDFAISQCEKLTTVSLPSTLTTVGSLFGYCTSLVGATYGGAVYLGNSANEHLYLLRPESTDLTSVTLHADTVFIASEAFEDCTSLETAVLNDGLKYVGYGAFSGCTSLSSVNLPSSIVEIDAHTFQNCTSLTEVVLPDGIDGLYSDLFLGCTALESVSIPNSVTYIAYDVFNGCSSLTTIIFRGTAEEWTNMLKFGTWQDGTPEYTVKCTDADVPKSTT